MDTRRPSVSIGIPAYNAEMNICTIIASLLDQRGDFDLGQILVHSDSSLDSTAELVKSMGDSRVVLLENLGRIGFAGSLIRLMRESSGDIFVTFNDDIKIEDADLVQKLISPFRNEPKVGLVGGRPVPLTPVNFLDKAITSTFMAYDRMRLAASNKHSQFTYDGKILALSRGFINSLTYPEDRRLMANVDSFLYFSCLANGFRYRFANDAVVRYRNPTNLSDYVKWVARNKSNKFILAKTFGAGMVEREYAPPTSLARFKLLEFFRNPIGCAFIYAVAKYVNVRSKDVERNFDVTWDSILSTKDLRHE